jgi:hypothetical protein
VPRCSRLQEYRRTIKFASRSALTSALLRSIAEENDLSKTTLQHIKSVLSGIFTHAKNESAFDGANPIHGALLPSNARESRETYAYNLP